MKKTLSLLLALIMCVSCFSISISANAQTWGAASITLNGTMYGGIVQEAINSINSSRTYYGAPALTVDGYLTEVAEKRAAEIMLYADTSNDNRPDGNSIYSLLPDYNNTDDTIFGKIYSATAYSLESALYSLKTHGPSLKSIGVGVFEYDGVITYYAVVSTKDATSYPWLYTREQACTVDVLVSNFRKSYINYTSMNGGRYSALSCEVYFNGYYNNSMILPNELIDIVSSDNKLYKIKDYNGYFKKNGKFTITAMLKDGTVICSDKKDFSGYNKVKPTLKSLKSKKKKKITVNWSSNIIDIEGFEIVCATDKNFKKNKKTVLVKGKNKKTKTISGLKSKKTYYVRVRGYIDQGNNERAYTNWSNTKKLKVK